MTVADNLGVTSTESPTEGTQNQDVNAASSTAQGVTAGSPPVDDRPEENRHRETLRKVDRMQQQIDQVLAYLVSGQQQQQAPASKTEPPTDEELWGLAQQGDRAAFDEYMARKARREVSQNQTVNRRQQIVAGQLQAIVNKYPVLNNPQHPLAQTMQQAYQLLLQNGYAQGPETLLEAAKTAIADRPDLVAEHWSQASQAREQVRQDSTRRAQSGVMGGTYRQEPRNTQTPKASPEEQALAARMGVKDPAKAMERFRERQKSGRSSFGAVAAFIPEEGQ
jgi:hypothetical protein